MWDTNDCKVQVFAVFVQQVIQRGKYGNIGVIAREVSAHPLVDIADSCDGPCPRVLKYRKEVRVVAAMANANYDDLQRRCFNFVVHAWKRRRKSWRDADNRLSTNRNLSWPSSGKKDFTNSIFVSGDKTLIVRL